MKRAVVFPDQHYPIHDVKAMNVALQVLEKAKPDIFVNLGDVGSLNLYQVINTKGESDHH